MVRIGKRCKAKSRTMEGAVDAEKAPEWHWVGPPLSSEQVRERYPNRTVGNSVPAGYVHPGNIDNHKQANAAWIAKAHYTTFEDDDGLKISVGDYVEVNGSKEGVYFYMHVLEIFEEACEGEPMFDGHYFYLAEETVMANECLKQEAGNESVIVVAAGNKREPTDVVVQVIEVQQDPQRLFLATKEDNATYLTVQSLLAVEKVVEIVRVKPGSEPPAYKENRYWFDQCHTQQFFTFRDVIQPEDLAEIRRKTSKTPKKLKVLELCSGVGGLGYLCQTANVDGVSVTIEPTWAVDFDQPACMAYQINHPHTVVFCTGIDEVLMLSKIWKEEVLSKWSRKNYGNMKPSQAVLRILEVRLRESADRGKAGQSKGQLMAPLKRKECWLEYLVTRRDNHLTSWVKDSEMGALNCPAEMAEFVAEWSRMERIPVPGDVGMIMGGPPCQGLSGLNRNAKREDILNDPKNRLIKTYYDLVEWFKPRYTLTEQVLDMFKKENGRYARFVAASLVSMRYQCRIGIIAAGDHGCPQGRYRSITWGAAPGEVLPAFPEPSHRCAAFKTGVPNVAKVCRVTFQSEAAQQAAWPMTLIGDILEDLPPISNFTMSDCQDYASEPTRPWQLYLRRQPAAGERSWQQRVEEADKLMRRNTDEALIALIKLYRDQGPAALGREFFCKKSLNLGLKDEVQHKLKQQLGGTTFALLGKALHQRVRNLYTGSIRKAVQIKRAVQAKRAAGAKQVARGKGLQNGKALKAGPSGITTAATKTKQALKPTPAADAPSAKPSKKRQAPAPFEAGPSQGMLLQSAQYKAAAAMAASKRRRTAAHGADMEAGAAAAGAGAAGRDNDACVATIVLGQPGIKSTNAAARAPVAEAVAGKQAPKKGKSIAAANAAAVAKVKAKDHVRHRKCADAGPSNVDAGPCNGTLPVPTNNLLTDAKAAGKAAKSAATRTATRTARTPKAGKPGAAAKATKPGKKAPAAAAVAVAPAAAPAKAGKGAKGGKGKAAAAAAAGSGAEAAAKGGRGKKANKGGGAKCGDADGAADDEGGEEEGAENPLDIAKEANYVAQTWTALVAKITDLNQRTRLITQRHRAADTFAQLLGEMIYAEVAQAACRSELGLLRDHRSLQCNADDYLRMSAVPTQKHCCFRDMAGVHTNKDNTCCAGHCHAAIHIKDGVEVCGCEGGGTHLAPKYSLTKESRIDQHDKDGWRGEKLDKCQSETYWLPTGDLLCPRWCITYQRGKSGLNGSRQSCYGRVWYDEIQPTVVTRAEPHNLKLVHPTQDRVLSVREMARSQGFPDYHVLVGIDLNMRQANGSIPTRYRQMGNAVAPPMAAALGRCLALALAKPRQANGCTEEVAVISVPDPDMTSAYEEARRRGLIPYSMEHKLDDSCWPLGENPFRKALVARRQPAKRKQPAAAADQENAGEGAAQLPAKKRKKAPSKAAATREAGAVKLAEGGTAQGQPKKAAAPFSAAAAAAAAAAVAAAAAAASAAAAVNRDARAAKRAKGHVSQTAAGAMSASNRPKRQAAAAALQAIAAMAEPDQAGPLPAPAALAAALVADSDDPDESQPSQSLADLELDDPPGSGM